MYEYKLHEICDIKYGDYKISDNVNNDPYIYPRLSRFTELDYLYPDICPKKAKGRRIIQSRYYTEYSDTHASIYNNRHSYCHQYNVLKDTIICIMTHEHQHNFCGTVLKFPTNVWIDDSYVSITIKKDFVKMVHSDFLFGYLSKSNSIKTFINICNSKKIEDKNKVFNALLNTPLIIPSLKYQIRFVDQRNFINGGRTYDLPLLQAYMHKYGESIKNIKNCVDKNTNLHSCKVYHWLSLLFPIELCDIVMEYTYGLIHHQ